MVLGGGLLGLRRLRARETRVQIDIEEEILAKYPNRRVDLVAAERRVDDAELADLAEAASWSASAEAGIVIDVTQPDAELVTVAARAVRSPEDIQRDDRAVRKPSVERDQGTRKGPKTKVRRRVGPPTLGEDWDPSQPLPGEPTDRAVRPALRSAPELAARLVEGVGDDSAGVFPRSRAAIGEAPPDTFEMLRRQRDHIAAQVQSAYREVHAVRTDALRRASQAEASAERAATARERAARLVREGRRLDEAGRRRSAEVAAPEDSFRAVHELRIDSLKRAAEAEHGAERVQMLREKAARLLAEQRRLEAEMAKHLAQRRMV